MQDDAASPVATEVRAVPTTSGPRAWFRRPVVAGLVLLLAYVGLSFLNDPGGSLGTDTGGKLATLVAMDQRGDLDPDVGYWAAAQDPEGRVHGLFYTSKVGERFVNVTSLPMVLAGGVLWRIGGYRAALLLPMLGGVAAAFGARALARRTSSGDGWPAFWIVGLASPVTIYALDLWEHSLGVALMVWGTVALVDAAHRRPTWWRGLLAGAAFGAAFAMRTEAGVYAVVFVAVTCVTVLLGRRDLLGAVVTGATAVAGFAVLFVANHALEQQVLGQSLRSARTQGAATSAGSQFALRAREGLITSLSPFPAFDGGVVLLSVGLVLSLCLLVWSSARGRDRNLAVVAAVVVGVIELVRLSGGLGFVPGMVAATPFAAVALVLAWRIPVARTLAVMAILALPLVFLFQFPGGAGPQWAGRYLLTSGIVLAAVGVACSSRVEPWVRTYLVVLSVAVTAFGLAWLSVRSHDVARSAELLERRPEAVLISPDGFVPREFGASYGRAHWLASANDADLAFAVDVADRSGAPDFALVSVAPQGDPPRFPGWTAGASEQVPFIGDTAFRVTHYERTGTTP